MGGIDEILNKYTVKDKLDPKFIDQIINNAVMHDQEQPIIKQKNSLMNKISDFFCFNIQARYVFAPSGGIMAMAVMGVLIGFNGGVIGGDNQTSMLLDPIFYQDNPLNQDINLITDFEDIEYE